MQKNIGKSSKKSSKIDVKTNKNHEKTMGKKRLKNERPPQSTLGNPGEPAAPVRVTKRLQKDNKRKTT